MKSVKGGMMYSSKTLMSAVLAMFAFALASPALSQTAAEEFIFYPSEADEYFFFDATSGKTIADYKTDKLVRVCVDDNEHLVPLEVRYDGESSEVKPGDCFRFEAKQVYMEPAKQLEPNWVLKAEVDTLHRSS
ncbi:MAG: hypothetical protein U5K76_15460 [Woeseiaceae bacterium]|nr:hypothetical protein [Woeseiaceae bacterium]